jgi:hypothetical protein
MTDDDEYEAVGGMRIGRGNRSTRRNPAPVPLCPPQSPHDLTWDRTRAAAMASRRLTACGIARPSVQRKDINAIQKETVCVQINKDYNGRDLFETTTTISIFAYKA